MRVESEYRLVAENGQYIHEGDPVYRDGVLLGRFSNIFEDGAPKVTVFLKHEDGQSQQFDGAVVEDWTAEPSLTEHAPECLRRFVEEAEGSNDLGVMNAAQADLAYRNQICSAGKTPNQEPQLKAR